MSRAGSDWLCTRNIHLYVAGASGDDSNDGSVAAPLKTLVEAESRIPTLGQLFHDVLIDIVEPGTYALPSFRPRIYQTGQIYIRAIPTTVVRASSAALAGTTAQSIKASGLATDQYIDAFVRILTGAAAGQRRLIKTNTATDIFPVRDFSVAPAQGDLYEIVTPLVTLTGGTSTSLPTLNGTSVRIHALTLAFELTLNFENFIIDKQVLVNGRVVFWQCQTTSTGILLPRDGHAMCGADSSAVRGAVGPTRVYGGSEKDWLGNGLAHQFNQEPDAGGLYGYINATHGLFIRNFPYTQICGGNIRGDHTTVDGPNVVAFFGGDAGAIPQLLDGPAQNTGTLRVRNGAACVLQRGSIAAQSGDIGVGVTAHGFLDIVGLSSAVQIAGNTFGVHARYGGRVHLHEANPAITHTSLSPGTANYAVGEVPDTAASIPNVGDVLVPSSRNDGSIIERVE